MFCLPLSHIVVYRDTDIVYRVPHRAVCIAIHRYIVPALLPSNELLFGSCTTLSNSESSTMLYNISFFYRHSSDALTFYHHTSTFNVSYDHFVINDTIGNMYLFSNKIKQCCYKINRFYNRYRFCNNKRPILY